MRLTTFDELADADECSSSLRSSRPDLTYAFDLFVVDAIVELRLTVRWPKVRALNLNVRARRANDRCAAIAFEQRPQTYSFHSYTFAVAAGPLAERSTDYHSLRPHCSRRPVQTCSGHCMRSIVHCLPASLNRFAVHSAIDDWLYDLCLAVDWRPY